MWTITNKLVADKVLLVLFYVRFGDCKIDVAALPIKIWFAVNDDAPVPPLEIDEVPNDTVDTFKFVNDAPEPEKVAADMFVADIVVPDKTPVNVPPVKGKNNDNVEDIGVPYIYIFFAAINII